MFKRAYGQSRAIGDPSHVYLAPTQLNSTGHMSKNASRVELNCVGRRAYGLRFDWEFFSICLLLLILQHNITVIAGPNCRLKDLLD
jgi:hypothetical protein